MQLALTFSLIRWYLGMFRRRGRSNLFGRNHSLAFQYAIELACLQVLYCLNLARGPAYLQAIDLRRLIQPEVYSQVILRKVASPAVNLFRLRHASSYELQPGSDRQSIALGSRQLETHPMPARNAVVLQHHRRAIKVVDHHIHVAIVE